MINPFYQLDSEASGRNRAVTNISYYVALFVEMTERESRYGYSDLRHGYRRRQLVVTHAYLARRGLLIAHTERVTFPTSHSISRVFGAGLSHLPSLKT